VEETGASQSAGQEDVPADAAPTSAAPVTGGDAATTAVGTNDRSEAGSQEVAQPATDAAEFAELSPDVPSPP
jgi:hypothetical protein